MKAYKISSANSIQLKPFSYNSKTTTILITYGVNLHQPTSTTRYYTSPIPNDRYHILYILTPISFSYLNKDHE